MTTNYPLEMYQALQESRTCLVAVLATEGQDAGLRARCLKQRDVINDLLTGMPDGYPFQQYVWTTRSFDHKEMVFDSQESLQRYIDHHYRNWRVKPEINISSSDDYLSWAVADGTVIEFYRYDLGTTTQELPENS